MRTRSARRLLGVCFALATFGVLVTSCSGGGAAVAVPSPTVRITWAVPTPAGYVSLSSYAGVASAPPTGVQTLKDVAASGPDNSGSAELHRAGWLSGISMYWVPKGTAQPEEPYAVDPAINQFRSASDAAHYQAKNVSDLSRKANQGPDGLPLHVDRWYSASITGPWPKRSSSRVLHRPRRPSLWSSWSITRVRTWSWWEAGRRTQPRVCNV